MVVAGAAKVREMLDKLPSAATLNTVSKYCKERDLETVPCSISRTISSSGLLRCDRCASCSSVSWAGVGTRGGRGSGPARAVHTATNNQSFSQSTVGGKVRTFSTPIRLQPSALSPPPHRVPHPSIAPEHILTHPSFPSQAVAGRAAMDALWRRRGCRSGSAQARHTHSILISHSCTHTHITS